ncbi:MAG TPA: hypothetical protein VFT64_11440 [Rickettsiales bacterium]|nr:hypothetical protein [Rickettsiales bacterium]
MSIPIVIYLLCYVFEGALRYGLHLAGADAMIFLRDALLLLPLAIIFLHQLLHKKLHPAFLIFFAVIVLHGFVILVNMKSAQAIAYGAKILITMVAGALGMRPLLAPSRKVLMLLLLVWAVSLGAICADKYFVQMPWVGMETQIEGVKVDISRDWQVSGAEKRAAGLMRDSIHAAMVMPLMALVLIFNLQNLPLRLFVALGTLPALVWTTQKGAIIAYLITLGLMALNPKRPINMLRLGVCFTIALCIALPLVFQDYTMPNADGVFSFYSFYLRIEWMWPDAWKWIHAHDAFPFGVGLGGIGGAQRVYAPDDVNAADNLFILMYAYFGVMTFVYLAGVLAAVAKIGSNASKLATEATAMLVFLFGYGCVISLIEDQMGSLYMGAALACVCHEIKRVSKERLQVQAQ